MHARWLCVDRPALACVMRAVDGLTALPLPAAVTGNLNCNYLSDDASKSDCQLVGTVRPKSVLKSGRVG